jgi:uncharacterized peroxidase-related enzyme
VALDEELAAALRRDHNRAPLNAADRAMVDYAARLTTAPARITRDDLARLREVGFDNRAVLQINLIASWFNYINRVADGLGVGRSLDEPLACPSPQSPGGPACPTA